MCCVLQLCIFNGVCNGDKPGRFTYISDSGNSVNDYFVSSYDLFDFIYSKCDFKVAERLESDHMPLEFYMNIMNVDQCASDKSDEKEYVEKFVWKDDLANDFCNV